jgi:hypothetical protein
MTSLISVGDNGRRLGQFLDFLGEWFRWLISCFTSEVCVVCVELSRPVSMGLGLFGSVFRVLLGDLVCAGAGFQQFHVITEDQDGFDEPPSRARRKSCESSQRLSGIGAGSPLGWASHCDDPRRDRPFDRSQLYI